MVDCQQAHSLMMRHEALDQFRRAFSIARCIVERLEEAMPRQTSLRCEYLQIGGGLRGRQHQRQHARIGCNDNVARTVGACLQRTNAEAAILILRQSVSDSTTAFLYT